MIYHTIKEAVINSTGDYGLISIYRDANGEETYFVNGKPSVYFKKITSDSE